MRYPPSGRQLFVELVKPPQQHVDLIRASLAVASEDRDDVNVERTLRILAHIVERSDAAISPHLSHTDRARELVSYLHDVEGFTGERDNYDDPANSLPASGSISAYRIADHALVDSAAHRTAPWLARRAVGAAGTLHGAVRER